MCMYIYIHMYVYIYIHIHTYTYIYICTYTQFLMYTHCNRKVLVQLVLRCTCEKVLALSEADQRYNG